MTTTARKVGGAAALVAGGLIAGAVLAGSLSASADTATSTPGATSPGTEAPANPNPGDPSKPQRSDETLLTGTTAEKVKAAVTAKYPNATFVRVETDSDGVYEAHITKADGTPVTVELDGTFAITGEEAGGFGHGGPGAPGDHDGDGPGSTGTGTTEGSST